MKTVINVGIGGKGFSLDEDAFAKLDSYLKAFKEKTGMNCQTGEIMDEVESRIAELFTEYLAAIRKDVVDITMVNRVIATLGMPDGSETPEFATASGKGSSNGNASGRRKPGKFYRDPDDKKIGGVCSGLAAHLDLDITLIRIIFLAALFCASVGFWIYVILWVVAPPANTAAQKCEMHGEAATVENMKKYMNNR